MSYLKRESTAEARLIRWVIDKDHRATFTSPAMGDNMGGTAGPGRLCGRFDIETPDAFRLLDSEGVLLYEGRTNAGTKSAQEREPWLALLPLLEVGEARGAVHIEYFIKGAWKRVRRQKDGKAE